MVGVGQWIRMSESEFHEVGVAGDGWMSRWTDELAEKQSEKSCRKSKAEKTD